MAMISPLTILKLQEQYVSAAKEITQLSKGILNADDFSYVPGMPNLQRDQKDACQEANFWMNTIWTLIIKTANDIFQFAKDFKTCYEKCLNVLKTNQPDMKHQIILLLLGVKLTLDDMNTYMNVIVGLVQDFHDNYQSLNTRMQLHLDDADKIIAKDEEELRKLKGDRTYYLGRRAYWGRMAYIPFYGIYAAMKYREVSRKLREVEEKIREINRYLLKLNKAEDSIRSLKATTSVMRDSSDRVGDAWVSLSSDLDSVISDIREASQDESAHKIKIDLWTAYMDWKHVAEHAHHIIDN
jgi:hypothetical protein